MTIAMKKAEIRRLNGLGPGRFRLVATNGVQAGEFELEAASEAA